MPPSALLGACGAGLGHVQPKGTQGVKFKEKGVLGRGYMKPVTEIPSNL